MSLAGLGAVCIWHDLLPEARDDFHQIVADAFQRMVLRNTTPEDAYQEVVTKYNDALAKAK